MAAPVQRDALAPFQVLTDIAWAAESRIATLSMDCEADLLDRVDQAVTLLDLTMPGRPYHDLPPMLTHLAGGDPRFGALLAARLLAGVGGRKIARDVPDAILPGLRCQALRILAAEAPSLDEDAFRKDLSVCLLLSFPCVAQVIEETGTIPRRALAAGGIGPAWRMLRHLAAGGFRRGPYLEIHTHTPMLDGFTPAGWERCYELAARLLAARPACRGLVGGSWFYDPALATVSPRLTYLADTPLAAGAFRMRLGSSPHDAELATATSPTRRAMARQGRYVPTRWLLVWPRQALLGWAAARNGAKS